MAIKIPSKNIYEMENPKVRDNVIDNVSVEQTVVAPNNEYGNAIYNDDISNISNIKYEENTKKLESKRIPLISGGIIASYYFAHAYLNNKLGYYETTFQIPRLKDNKYITKLYRGTKEENGKIVDEDVIFFQVYGETKTTSLEATVTLGDTAEDDTITAKSYGEPTTKEGIIDISDLPKVVTSKNTWADPDLVAEIIGLSGKSSYTIQPYTDNDDYITVNLSILCYELVEEMKGAWDYSNPSGKTYTITGQQTIKTPKEISITAYGNTVGISLTDGSITYIKDDSGNIVEGVGNKPHSLSKNELLQDSATTNSNSTTKELAKNILTQYEKGKETATLLCDINEYYDYDNNDQLKISVKNNGLPMTFKIGDEVIPMIFSKDKRDVPMSKYKNGNPKVFKIVGIEKIYDGAVWQKLYMQEK